MRRLAFFKWQLVLTAALVGLGANGLCQVWLNRDMHAKTDQLSSQVRSAQILSERMKDSLNGLDDVQRSTLQMASTLDQLEATTAHMDSGLATLERTVKGLAGAIQSLGTGTAQSRDALSNALSSARALLATLDSVRARNASAIDHLNQMVQEQSAINSDLHEMNQKTAFLP
jgi:chromosome segregation ATPase